MKGRLSEVCQDTTTIMGIKGPSGRTLLLYANQGILMNCTLMKHFMNREKEYKDGKRTVRK